MFDRILRFSTSLLAMALVAGPGMTNTPVWAAAVPNIAQAQADGRADGTPDGAREGDQRGVLDGQREGLDIGHRDGFARCQKEEAQKAYDSGFQQGYQVGSNRGVSDGQVRGQSEGAAKGHADGLTDGSQRADNDAKRDSYAPGAAKGTAEANQSDATERGHADGLVQGDVDAKQEALDTDYPRGRKDYRNERYAAPVSSEDQFSQVQGSSERASSSADMNSLLSARESDMSTGATEFDSLHMGGLNSLMSVSASPDYRYQNPRRSYPTPQETSAYHTAYHEAYAAGFQSRYSVVYQGAYNGAYNNGQDQGCAEARHGNYYSDAERGRVDGDRRGYDDAFQRGYQLAYQPAYNSAFSQASHDEYNADYNGDYQRHFEEARQEAYRQRVDQLYNAAFSASHDQKYNQVYPGYAKAQYQRGREDEAQDFIARPVRLVTADVTETIPNGLYEPGEPLRVKLALRNFAKSATAGRDVRVTIEALDQNSAVITQSEATLVRDLRADSQTVVSDALEFRMNESAVEKTSQFRLRVTYQGRDAGETTLDVKTRFMIGVELAEQPVLKDGMPTVIKVKLTNQSAKASDALLKAKLLIHAEQVDVQNGEQTVASLAPGESTIVEFTVTAHTGDNNMQIPIAVTVTGSGGRRIGVLDATQEAPVVNDYRVSVVSDLSTLRGAGVTRVVYKVQNVGTRLLYRSLQLRVRFKGGADASNFTVIGPNPQYLWPLDRGESVQFLVPVNVAAANAGGTIEFELQEDGRTVVAHDENFSASN